MKFFSNIVFLSKLTYKNIKSYFRKVEIPTYDSLDTNSLIWLGHATVLINLDGKLILTDPVTSSFIGYFKRHVKLPIDPSKLKIDYILLSHGHTDHIHFPSIRKLNKDATIIVPNGYDKITKFLGFKNVVLMHSSEIFKDDNIKITCYDANHDGRRFYLGNNYASNSYLIERNNKKIFFAGDTAHTEGFKGLKSDVALMPVGCYKPDRFSEMHCTPEESYDMYKMMECPIMIPIHYKTFTFSLEDTSETISRINDINDKSIKLIDIGEKYTI